MDTIVWRLVGAALCVGAARGATLHGVTPGRSTRVEMHRQLGAPVAGRGTGEETFEAKGSGLARIALHYDAKGVVRRARFEPAEQLTLDLATLLFELTDKRRSAVGHPFDTTRAQGTSAHYDADGVHFYIRDKIVREIWLVTPGQGRPAPASPAAAVPPAAVPPTAVPGLPPLARPPATAVGRPTAPVARPPTPATPPLVTTPARPTPAPQPGVVAAVPQALRDVRVGRGGTPPSFRGIVVGQSDSKQVAAALGPPRFVGRRGPQGFACEHDGRAFGLHGVLVRYGQGGRVGQLDLRFASPLPRGQVARALGLGQPAATAPFLGCVVELHASSSVELTVQGGAVTSLRLTGASLGPPTRVATMPQPAPPPTAPAPLWPAPPPTAPPPTAPAPAPVAPAPAPVAPAPTPAAAGPPALRQVQTVPAQAAGARVVSTPRVTVRRVWYKADMQVAGEPGLVVYADLLASGCKGQQMTATVRLRQHTGQPVMAARGAPARFVDSRGRFAAPAPDQVLHDTAQWQAYQVFVPYRFLDLPRGQVHNLAISFTATCKGQRTGMEAICTFRTP